MIMVIPTPQSALSGQHQSSLPLPAAPAALLIIATVMNLPTVIQPNWRRHICAERVQLVYGPLFSSSTRSHFRTAIFVGGTDEAISLFVFYCVYIDG